MITHDNYYVYECICKVDVALSAETARIGHILESITAMKNPKQNSLKHIYHRNEIIVIQKKIEVNKIYTTHH